MSSHRIEIPRPGSEGRDQPPPSVTNVEHLASYNWIDSPLPSPTIAVPGCPPRWSPPGVPTKIAKDHGLVYIAQNAYRHPTSPLEPLFRSLLVENPSYDFHKVNLITDRNNIRKLLSFVNPDLSRNGLEPFAINVEVVGNTAILCRTETKTHEFIGRNDRRGYGHEFEKAFTTSDVSGSTGHHRIISYDLGGLKLIVRYETDAYVEDSKPPASSVGSGSEDILESLQNLSLSEPKASSDASTTPGLTIQERGKRVAIESTLGIKTSAYHRTINFPDTLTQLWASQTPKIVRAYHEWGLFQPPEVEDVTSEITEWEKSHADDLRKLITLFKEIIAIVKERDGAAVIKYDEQCTNLTLWKAEDRKMLPEDLYLRLAERPKQDEPDDEAKKTKLKIGDTFYTINVAKIPYLAAFVRFQRKARSQDTELIHGEIPLFEFALNGVVSGYRQSFRLLGSDVSQYHTLCDTYDFLGVDVLAGQSIDDIFVDLKATKTDFDVPLKADKCRARDAAFRLVFLMILGQFTDEVKDAEKTYHVVMFVVSHPGTFKKNTRTVVRSIFEERFVVSKKQRTQLDRWQNKFLDGSSGDESTSDDEPFEYYSDSDD